MMVERFLYLIEAKSGEVKIGCSNDPYGRAHAIGMSSPHEVRLIAMWPGTFPEEHVLHHQFSQFRHYREWFRLEGEFAEFVAQKRGVGVELIAPWGGVYTEDFIARQADKARRISAALKASWADPEFRQRQADWRAATGRKPA